MPKHGLRRVELGRGSLSAERTPSIEGRSEGLLGHECLQRKCDLPGK